MAALQEHWQCVSSGLIKIEGYAYSKHVSFSQVAERGQESRRLQFRSAKREALSSMLVTIAASVDVVKNCVGSERSDLDFLTFSVFPVIISAQVEKTRFSLSLQELREATNNFDPAHKLGAGGFGTVYRGVLPSGREFAVKRSGQGQKDYRQFRNEVKALDFCQRQIFGVGHRTNICHHRMLIIIKVFQLWRLSGCCQQGLHHPSTAM